MHSLHSEIL